MSIFRMLYIYSFVHFFDCYILIVKYIQLKALFFMQMFFMKLMDLLVLEHTNIPYEKREMTLEYINQVFPQC